jgi:2-keto-4-pentenoate hydratase/2-oxohepta-3-ene-1,7-dioic acid hydratase in catechol pathway
MRLVRFVADDEPAYGLVGGEQGEETILQLKGDPIYTEVEPTQQVRKLEDVRLLAPVLPRSKVVGITFNSVDSMIDPISGEPREAMLFLKPNTSVVGPGDPIVMPAYAPSVHIEAELAVVIGKMCRDVAPADADKVILGYTVANDVTAEVGPIGGALSKAFDSSCPLGPWIETELDLERESLRSWIDGELCQDAPLSDMVLGVPELVSQVSRMCSLLPGDVILTGTPSGNRGVEPGNSVTCEVTGIGTLSNSIIRR